jgi:hypothetical protein
MSNHDMGRRLIQSKQAPRPLHCQAYAGLQLSYGGHHLPLPSTLFVTSSIIAANITDHEQDGVLIHGSSVLPEAKRALAILNGKNKQGM